MSTTTKITCAFVFAMLASLPEAAADDGCVPPPKGIIAWWPGNGNAKDVAGGRHGTPSGSAGFTSGMVGDAFRFDGGGSIDIPDDPAWTLGARDFTIDLWVRFDGLSGRDPLIAHDTGGGGQNKWIFWYDTSGHDKQSGVPALRFHINGSGVFPHDAIVAAWTPNTGQWYHLAVTRSGTTYALYIDGAQVATDTSPYAIPDPSGPVTIGSAEGYRVNGTVDEVDLFGRALSASEVQSILAAGGAGRCNVGVENLLWAKHVGVANDGVARAAGVLPDGSSIVMGHYRASATFGAGEPNETTLASGSGYNSFVAKYDADGLFRWARGTSSSIGEAFALGGCAFPDGSSIATGKFYGRVTLGAWELWSASGKPGLFESTRYATDAFVARYRADGSLLWARRAGGNTWSSTTIAYGAAAFADGSSAVTGYFYSGIATFGAGEPNETTLWSGPGYWAPFVARYEANGSLRWARGVSSPSGEAFALSVAPFSDGSCVVAGYSLGSVTLGVGEPNQTTLASIGVYQPFLAKYDADGTLRWVRNASLSPGHGLVGHGFASGAGAFPDGSSIATGYFYGTATFGAGEPNETTLVSSSAPSYDGFVARYEADGSLAWVRRAGTATSWGGETRPTGAAAFPDGSSVVPGFFLGSATFGVGEPNETTLFASYTDAFVARYWSDGSLAWVKRAGGVGPSVSQAYAWGAAACPDGSAIIPGQFVGSAAFGPSEVNETTFAATGLQHDIFVARYATEGALRIVAPVSIVHECDGADEGGDAHATIAFSFDVQGAPPATAVLSVRDVTGNRTLLEQPATEGTFDVGPYGFPMGASTVTIQVTDGGIVLATATATVQVQDTLVPVLSGVGPKTIELQGPLTMLCGSLLGIEATDDCDPNPSLTFVPAAVPLGLTLVTAMATDATGGASAWPFEVTVVDTTPPAFDVVPSDIERECVGGSAIVNFDILASDLSGAVTLVCTDQTGRAVDPGGTTFDDGVHTVTCVASDGSGKEATISFTITVSDNTAPVIVTPDDITVPTDPGVSFAYVTFSVTATDSCDPAVPIVCTTPLGDVQSGDAFPVGLTVVTCTARDDAGNEARATFQILVRDMEPPVLTCPAAFTLHTDTVGTPLSITPQVLGASASDNCDPMPLVFCTPAVAPVGTTTVTVNARDADGNESTAAVDVTVLLAGQETTATGSDIVVTPQALLPNGSTAPVTLAFDQVTQGGVTTVTTAPTGPPPPNGFKLGTPPIYYDVSTTAVFTGTIELCFTWQAGQVKNESKLKLFHREGTQWVDVTTSVDTVNNVICGVVTSLSPFILAEPGYTFGGVLPPIAADGSSVFKRGRVVPVKFQLFNPDGTAAAGAVVVLKLVKISNSVLGTVEEEIDPATVGSANTGNLFRYDADERQFIYNLATSGLSVGTYRLEILPDEGSSHTVQVSLRN